MVRTSTSWIKTSAWWRTDGFVGLLVVAAVLWLQLGTDLVGTLERRFYDFANSATARTASPQIAIIAIDDTSIANLGRWPWSRELHARLINQLASAQAKVVVHTAFFFEPQTERGLPYIRRIKDLLGPAAEPGRVGGLAGELARIITEAEQALDADVQLAGSLQRAGNVLLPSSYTLGEAAGPSASGLPVYARNSTLASASGSALTAVRGQQPIPLLGSVAAGIGQTNLLHDVDGAVRSLPLLLEFDGRAVPSLALLAAARSLNLNVADLRLVPGQELKLGPRHIAVDAQARLRPQFYKATDGHPAVAVDSFFDVVSGKINLAKYADRIVFIGVTAAGLASPFATPAATALTPVEVLAHATSSLLEDHVFVKPSWGLWLELAAWLLVAGYLIAWLPRLSAAAGAASTLALLFGLLLVEFAALTGAGLWFEWVLAAVLLLTGHLALTTKRFLLTESGKLRSERESAETNREMALALQGQGQFDMAFDRLRRVPLSDTVMENLYQLGQDFERKRQFSKALAVYEHMSAWDADYKDLAQRLPRLRGLPELALPIGVGAMPQTTLRLADGVVEKPMLGRYQIERELGKGAMGVVYQGLDPKIGRVVAIKTLALSQEFEGHELVDVRNRFFREAETAGRLQHQNIVTIFDAGEEHDLAYIAMEFLRGHDLSVYCREGQLLPLPTVLAIVAQVADALAYAHSHSVVHRDIKPANIMFDPQTETVKVTDFGVARITDASRTRTGMVLGTPSFMSPEQLAGKKVDGRSDLYSLGVMLFQLLTGTLPMRGDSMTELMDKIAHEEAPDVRSRRSELSPELAQVVALSLRKQPDTRYQNGSQFAHDLRALLVPGSANPASPALSAAPVLTTFEATQPLPPDLTGSVSDSGFSDTVVGEDVKNLLRDNDNRQPSHAPPASP